MARAPRVQSEGSHQHVTVHGNDGAGIFIDDADRQSFLALLGRAGDLARWHLLSYCLMSNEAHLLLELGPDGMSKGMHLLTSTHSRRFNSVHNRNGHVFGRRFSAKVLVTHASLMDAFQRVALTPCRARVTRTPDEWTWSAHRALAGISCPLPFLERDRALSYFEGGERGYRTLISDCERTTPKTLKELLSVDTAAIIRANKVHGYSQAEIALALGVSPMTISRRIRRGDS